MVLPSLGFSKSDASSVGVTQSSRTDFNSSGWTVSTGKSRADGAKQDNLMTWVVIGVVAFVAIKYFRR